MSRIVFLGTFTNQIEPVEIAGSWSAQPSGVFISIRSAKEAEAMIEALRKIADRHAEFDKAEEAVA